MESILNIIQRRFHINYKVIRNLKWLQVSVIDHWQSDMGEKFSESLSSSFYRRKGIPLRYLSLTYHFPPYTLNIEMSIC